MAYRRPNATMAAKRARLFRAIQQTHGSLSAMVPLLGQARFEIAEAIQRDRHLAVFLEQVRLEADRDRDDGPPIARREDLTSTADHGDDPAKAAAPQAGLGALASALAEMARVNLQAIIDGAEDDKKALEEAMESAGRQDISGLLGLDDDDI